MNSVKFYCPTTEIANVLAVLSENGTIGAAINEYMERVGLDGRVDEYTSPDFDERDFNHTVELDLE